MKINGNKLQPITGVNLNYNQENISVTRVRIDAVCFEAFILLNLLKNIVQKKH